MIILIIVKYLTDLELTNVLVNCHLPLFVVDLVEIESDDTSASEIAICSAFSNCFVVVDVVEYVSDVGFLIIIAG